MSGPAKKVITLHIGQPSVTQKQQPHNHTQQQQPPVTQEQQAQQLQQQQQQQQTQQQQPPVTQQQQARQLQQQTQQQQIQKQQPQQQLQHQRQLFFSPSISDEMNSLQSWGDVMSSSVDDVMRVLDDVNMSELISAAIINDTVLDNTNLPDNNDLTSQLMTSETYDPKLFDDLEELFQQENDDDSCLQPTFLPSFHTFKNWLNGDETSSAEDARYTTLSLVTFRDMNGIDSISNSYSNNCSTDAVIGTLGRSSPQDSDYESAAWMTSSSSDNESASLDDTFACRTLIPPLPDILSSCDPTLPDICQASIALTPRKPAGKGTPGRRPPGRPRKDQTVQRLSNSFSSDVENYGFGVASPSPLSSSSPPSSPSSSPRGRHHIKRRRGNRSTHLWEFMRMLLDNSKYNPECIKWENKEEGVFRIVPGRSKVIAGLWGERKNNPTMTFDKLSRSLRWCRTYGFLSEVPRNGGYPKKLCFRFGSRALEWDTTAVA